MECLLESTKRSNSIYSTHPQPKQNKIKQNENKTKQNIDIDNETNNKFDSHLPIQKLDAFF